MWQLDVERGKKSNETVKPSSLILQHISVKWTLSSRQRLRTKAAQRKPSHSCCTEILEEEETSKGKLMFNQSAVKEECVVVLWCEKLILFALHLFQRMCVCVCHTALIDYSLSLKMRPYSLASVALLLSTVLPLVVIFFFFFVLLCFFPSRSVF